MNIKNNQIAQLDLPNLDRNIEYLESKVSDLNRILAVHKKFREELTVLHGEGITLGSSIEPIEQDIKIDTHSTTSVGRIPQTVNGVSDFILHVLKSGPKETKFIIAKYASYKKMDLDKARNNIQNALSRLKRGNRIDNTPNGTSQRDGSVWYLTPDNKN